MYIKVRNSEYKPHDGFSAENFKSRTFYREHPAAGGIHSLTVKPGDIVSWQTEGWSGIGQLIGVVRTYQKDGKNVRSTGKSHTKDLRFLVMELAESFGFETGYPNRILPAKIILNVIDFRNPFLTWVLSHKSFDMALIERFANHGSLRAETMNGVQKLVEKATGREIWPLIDGELNVEYLNKFSSPDVKIIWGSSGGTVP